MSIPKSPLQPRPVKLVQLQWKFKYAVKEPLELRIETDLLRSVVLKENYLSSFTHSFRLSKSASDEQPLKSL